MHKLQKELLLTIIFRNVSFQQVIRVDETESSVSAAHQEGVGYDSDALFAAVVLRSHARFS
jgi:hypothetical protein